MDVTPRIEEGLNIIHSYADGCITVGGTTYEAPVIITAQDIVQGTDLSELPRAEVLLVASNNPLPAEEFMSYKKQADGMEVMKLDSACRTYNVLLAEGRKVTLFLIKS